jgi:MATE family multidrug resistance protein
MAAAMPAGMLHFMMLCLPLGIAGYTNTFVAQYHGAERPGRIGLAIGQGVWVGILTAPVFLATIPLAPFVFRWAGHEPAVARLEVIYYQTLCYDAGAAVMSAALAAFFTGRGRTKVVMSVDMFAALVNVALDYAWVFGRFGFPEMGIAGAAWATVVAQWTKAAIYLALIMAPKYRRRYGTSALFRIDRPLMIRLLRYGGPNGLQLLVEVAAFSLFILLMGRLGQEAMASTTLAFNVNSIAFVPMLGLGLAVTTMVGQQLGRNRPRLAARATWTALCMALAYMGTMAALYLIVPDWFLAGHAAGTPPEEFARLRDITVVLLRFVAAYCLFDAMCIIFAGALKGAGDTRFILLTNLLTSPLPVLAAWWGIAVGGWGPIGCWWVITLWITAMGWIYLARFLQGRWRSMRVIEPELLSAPTLSLEEAGVAHRGEVM